MNYIALQTMYATVLTALLLTACTPAATPAPTPTLDPVVRGEELYESKGCAGCHGEGGGGTELGTALPGHTQEQVLKQVRAPRGQMPAFGPEKISDDELSAIAAYVVSLGPAAGAHGHGTFEATADEMNHLLLTFSALGADNVADAEHHLNHLIAISEGEARESYESLLADLQAGQTHDVEHEIEELVENSSNVGLPPWLLHVELAANALGREDSADAEHHLQHAIEISSGDEQAKLQSLLADLQAGQINDVEHDMEEMMAGMHK